MSLYMKKELFETQYNKSAIKFNKFYLDRESHKSTDTFFNSLKKEIIKVLPNKNVLDLGCGSGADAEFYTKKGLSYFGLDASIEMCDLAKQNTHITEIKNCSFSRKIPYTKNKFGLIVSKYAMQTSTHIEPIYTEVSRLLESKGFFVFLVVHPMRQFIEKKKQGKNYFKKEFVKSVIFDGKIIVTEPTHTLQEYLNADFLKKFSILDIQEGYDFPNSEQINGDIYPTFLIVTAQKK